MTPYFLFSAAAHAFVLAALIYFVPSIKQEPKYYVIDFMGGQSGAGPGIMQPAPAPAGGTSAAPVESPKMETPPATPPKVDARKVTVAKELDVHGKKADKKTSKKPAKPAAPKAPRNKGMKGGRGESAEGKGDVMGTKTGSVGGAGTSLEIGGFGPGGTVQAGPRFPYQWYVQTLYKRLWESWDRTDVGNKECGVAFTIEKDGTVTNVKVENPSGDSFFDLTASRAVDNAAPFPPLPEGFTEPRLRVVVKFRLQ